MPPPRDKDRLMLSTLKELFATFTHAPGDTPADRERALQVATAVLLVEVMRADTRIGDTERRAVFDQLGRKFALSGAPLAQLVDVATQAAKQAYDYHRFTSLLNDQLTQPQKIQLVENMWEVAYSDARLDAAENHVINKVAGLLYVTHGEYIGAKMRAKESCGLA